MIIYARSEICAFLAIFSPCNGLKGMLMGQAGGAAAPYHLFGEPAELVRGRDAYDTSK